MLEHMSFVIYPDGRFSAIIILILMSIAPVRLARPPVTKPLIVGADEQDKTIWRRRRCLERWATSGFLLCAPADFVCLVNKGKN
ncbi:MAG: hypothetical protein IPM39_12175 [Chloroflexi bacterium]|nr:hypothetical protein [Chloroflexota bacterium]